VLVDRFDPAALLQQIQQRGVTHIPVVPSMLQAFLQAPADSLRAGFRGVRHVLSGAAPLSAELSKAFTEATGVPVYEGYGLTEAAPGVTLTFVGGAPKPGSIGRPLPGVDVRLVDVGGFEFEPNGEGDPEEGPGELSIRGDNLFSGYWPDGSGGPDDDGWLPTGDVGYRDAAGDFVLVDRTRELIIVNGFNVYPREIESVLAAHPQVAEAAALGVPDETTGEAVKAFVVAMPGTELSVASVQAHCEEWLARFKQPREIVVVERLPHSPTGKISKRVLREQEG
jgi:long-chain acyl-CoA synthetase